MGTPHIHAAVIKAWADGAKIQENMYCGTTNPNKCWVDIGKNNQTILWCPKAEYRVKPEPKPDTIIQRLIVLNNTTIGKGITFLHEFGCVNVKFTFDAETNQLKSVDMIANE